MVVPHGSFEHSQQPVISRGHFIRRMFLVIGIWLVLTVVGLVIGIVGYAYFEGMSVVDAYVNAAMILSGMGPVGFADRLEFGRGDCQVGLSGAFLGFDFGRSSSWRAMHAFSLSHGRASGGSG
jgi:hypothetical protein